MPKPTPEFDAIILGAGAAGMMCAITAARAGKRVVVLDHAKKLGGKIIISGGGRCNFTNKGAAPENYVSQNPHFARSALSRYSPQAFIDLVSSHGIAFHEKKLGQLFCDHSAQNIVDLLRKEAAQASVIVQLNTEIREVKRETWFSVLTDEKNYTARSLVVATGGLSIPKLGATSLGYDLARQFGLALVETEPALDGFTWSLTDTEKFKSLAGVSADCVVSCDGNSFRENILFTHGGLSGPAALQASLYFKKGSVIEINLVPNTDLFSHFMGEKKLGNRSQVKSLLSQMLAARLAERLCELYFPSALPLPQLSEKGLEEFCHLLHAWKLMPKSTVGYSKAEVTRGGVSTDELSSKTMEAKKMVGLYFIGEVVDVTGWLGGYNFQWAWASGWAAGTALSHVS